MFYVCFMCVYMYVYMNVLCMYLCIFYVCIYECFMYIFWYALVFYSYDESTLAKILINDANNNIKRLREKNNTTPLSTNSNSNTDKCSFKSNENNNTIEIQRLYSSFVHQIVSVFYSRWVMHR